MDRQREYEIRLWGADRELLYVVTLSAGDNNLELFFADIHQVAAALTFNVTTEGVTGTPTVPEPFTLSLFGAGLAGAVAMRRRKKA